MRPHLSHSNFSVQAADCERLERELNQRTPPAAVAAWKVKRGGAVSVVWSGVWHRGIPVKKTGSSYSVFLIDQGYQVTVTQEEVRPLPEEFLDVPPFAYQVRSSY